MTSPATLYLLDAGRFQAYIKRFNADDEEIYPRFVSNSHSWEFLAENIPFFECPDEAIQRTYYFRWWTYRKHIKETPDGFVVTEFLPDVPWAGKHNTINLSSGMHLIEGRWLRDPRYLDDYARFWFRKGGSLRSYTTWLAYAIVERAKVTGGWSLALDLLDDMVANFTGWEQGWALNYGASSYHIGQGENGLFFTVDDRDGSEMSISGHGYRPLTNGAMYGEAIAIATAARCAGRMDLAAAFDQKAARIKMLVQEKLWDADGQFFKTFKGDHLADVRELWGYAPWYFNLPDAGYEMAWSQLRDPQGFYAPYGPTFAEQRHPQFQLSYLGHECQWNGPSWPMATSITLTGLANLLHANRQLDGGRRLFFDTLQCYTNSHRRFLEDGSELPWIDENLNPYTGDWISRTRLKNWENGGWSAEKGGRERGKDYNHSTYCDIIIRGLVGLEPGDSGFLKVAPLLPEGVWPYFCLDGVRYQGYNLTIFWDQSGERYQKGPGLHILVDGEEVACGQGFDPLQLAL